MHTPQQTHAETPWSYGQFDDGESIVLFDASGDEQICEMNGNESQQANAAYIVRCVNERSQYESLLALASHIIAMADDTYLTGHPEWIEIAREAESVIRHARAESEG